MTHVDVVMSYHPCCSRGDFDRASDLYNLDAERYRRDQWWMLYIPTTVMLAKCQQQ